MQSISILAHAEQAHSSTGESFLHLFESADIALMGWLLLIAATIVITKLLLRFDLPKILLALAGINLAYGVFLYNKSPAIGALVVSAGFALTLAIVIIGLQVHEVPSEKKG